MQFINIHHIKAKLSQLVKLARAGKDNAAVESARLTSIHRDLTPRQAGQLKGKIWIADNFDEFDKELEEMFYGSEE